VSVGRDRSGGSRRRWCEYPTYAATCTYTPAKPTAEAAKAQGYSYVAITDHSKALTMSNGLDEARAVAFARQVREINKKDLGIRIFSGLECDILRDGELDLANDALRAGSGDRQRAQAT
jgi:histidinol phosphatase-like PHP family hydrolase